MKFSIVMMRMMMMMVVAIIVAARHMHGNNVSDNRQRSIMGEIVELNKPKTKITITKKIQKHHQIVDNLCKMK